MTPKTLSYCHSWMGGACAMNPKGTPPLLAKKQTAFRRIMPKLPLGHA